MVAFARYPLVSQSHANHFQIQDDLPRGFYRNVDGASLVKGLAIYSAGGSGIAYNYLPLSKQDILFVIDHMELCTGFSFPVRLVPASAYIIHLRLPAQPAYVPYCRVCSTAFCKR